ncbi:MAG: PQQ-binding-like beta-propeller repeat protein [Gammaproteobacteria bacterium]
MRRFLLAMALAVAVAPTPARGQSTEASRLELAGAAASARDLGATANWGTYSGDYSSTRYSRLDQVDTTNVGRLAMQWAFQTGGALEATPLVLDGILYLAGASSTAYALDARTGRVIWHYRRNLPDKLPLCCGQDSRGLAVLSEKVYLGTLDAHLVALDAKTGSVLWDVEAAEFRKGYSFTVAPLIVKDKVVVGISGAEYGIRGFIDAYDAKTGRRAWRFHTIPGPGEPENDTWKGNSWEKGGGSAWVTGSYDPEVDLIYWGVGNPAPALYGDDRGGDNLYTDAVVALDSDTGELRWHYQFTPHDVHDWDAAQAIVLLDFEMDGAPRKLLAQANRNGFFYVLDRTNGAFLHAKPFAKVTWASEVRADGRPVVLPGTDPSPEGTYVCPGLGGATNWHSPSFHPATGLVYVTVMEECNTFYSSPTPYREGLLYIGSASLGVPKERGRGAVRDRPAHGKGCLGVRPALPRLRKHPRDRRWPRLRGQRRGLPYRVRRAHGKAPVERPAGWRCLRRADDVRGQRKAVRRSRRGERRIRVRPSGPRAAKARAGCEPGALRRVRNS